VVGVVVGEGVAVAFGVEDPTGEVIGEVVGEGLTV
jgi:hypothetical protein